MRRAVRGASALALPRGYHADKLEGLTQSDAAEMLGISVSGMKSRVQRGREKLREMFDQCCEISVDCRGRVVGYEPRGGGCKG